jgi:hypothetical protein
MRNSTEWAIVLASWRPVLELEVEEAVEKGAGGGPRRGDPAFAGLIPEAIGVDEAALVEVPERLEGDIVFVEVPVVILAQVVDRLGLALLP